MNWRHILYSIIDCIYPLPEPLSKEERERPEKRLQERKTELEPLSDRVLTDYCLAVQNLLVKEHERKQGIEARLTAILGMSSIAGSVGIAGLFLGSGGLFHIQSRNLRWLVTAVGCYLILQICAGMLNAIRGLSRRGYLDFSPLDLLPSLGEPNSVFLRRKAEFALDVLSDHEAQNNEKLTQLARAHCALRNFLCGLLVFTVIGVFSMFRGGSDDELVDRLKKNHELYELLRGPQGIPGPKGEAGLPPAAPLPCTPSTRPSGRPSKTPPKTGQMDREPDTARSSKLLSVQIGPHRYAPFHYRQVVTNQPETVSPPIAEQQMGPLKRHRQNRIVQRGMGSFHHVPVDRASLVISTVMASPM